jgi:hypothetical protein
MQCQKMNRGKAMKKKKLDRNKNGVFLYSLDSEELIYKSSTRNAMRKTYPRGLHIGIPS